MVGQTRRMVAIAGGGIVGRTLALALATKSHLTARLFAGRSHPEDRRASAVSAAGRRLFERLGVWPLIAGEAQPIREMVITDSASEDTVRREALRFGEDAGAAPFAFMVPNAALHAALVRRGEEAGVTSAALGVRYFEEEPFAVALETDDGATHRAAVLVAADGRNSRLRAIAGIDVVEKPYRQVGIVGTLSHALPHHGRATQHFLPGGPFAMLPLKGERSSIVWTEREEFAETLLAMDPMVASLEIERVFGLSLGRLCVDGALQGHPLSAMLARSYHAGRLALLGDSAHVIHPLAGQGLNLGLRDVAALTEVLVEASRNGEDLVNALPPYERRRRPDCTQMALVTDALNLLFSRRSDVLRAVRSVGIDLVDRREGLKSYFIQEAAGLTGALPSLMRAEPT